MITLAWEGPALVPSGGNCSCLAKVISSWDSLPGSAAMESQVPVGVQTPGHCSRGLELDIIKAGNRMSLRAPEYFSYSYLGVKKSFLHCGWEC